MKNRARLATPVATLLLFVLVACTDKQQEVGVDQGAAVVDQEGQAALAITDAVAETTAVAEASPGPGASGYLTEVIPPCTLVEGVSVDPCQPNVPRVSYAGTFLDPGLENGPWSILFYLEGHAVRGAFFVVRATYLPKSIRCLNYTSERLPSYMGGKKWEIPSGIGFIRCYADVRVNEYIIGSGPPELTVIVTEFHQWNDLASAESVVAWRNEIEQLYIKGGNNGAISVPTGGIAGREEVMFVGPATDYSIEAWEVHTTWDVERKADGTVIVVHPFRHYWIATDASQYRAEVEKPLATFKQEAQAAQTTRMTKYGGRVDGRVGSPVMQTDATKLHQFHISVGNTTHADGPPEASLPPPCGKIVPNQTTNPGLMLDCFALLAAKDTLRGTGTLNWSVDTTIGSWDGVTTSATTSGASGASGSTASRVTGIALANKGLTGSVPAELEKLGLTTLNLTGNSLTGCIPAGLQSTTTNDLSTLNLLYCPPAPVPTSHSAGETTFTATWPAIANTSKYRLQYRLGTADAWTTVSDAITATSYTLGGLKCEQWYRFRLSAYGSGTVYAAAWSDPWDVSAITTACVTPSFAKATYAFSVAENSAGGSSVGSSVGHGPQQRCADLQHHRGEHQRRLRHRRLDRAPSR